MSFPHSWPKVAGRLILALLSLAASGSQAQTPVSPRDLIDGFSLELGAPEPALPAPSPAPMTPASGMVAVRPPPPAPPPPPPQPDWQPLRASEAALAARLRQTIARTPDDPQLTEPDRIGRTPLMQAALYGYADIVAALLTSPRVRADLASRDALDATAWQLAQFARPLTQLTCHSLYLAGEMEPLWRAQQWRAGYFQRGQETAFHSISRSLVAAGAATDTEAARAAWRRQCPGREEIVDTAVDAAPDLLAALLTMERSRAERWSQRWVSPLAAPPGTELRVGFPKYLPGRVGAATNYQQVCTHLPAPQAPVVNWGGYAELRTVAQLQAGRTVAATTWLVKSSNGMDRRTFQRLRLAINQAMAQYRCLGDAVFEQEFAFKIE